METLSPEGPSRRRALRRGLAVLAGLLLLGVGISSLRGAVPPAPPQPPPAPLPPAGSQSSPASQTGAPTGQAIDADITQGALRVKIAGEEIVECPLRHTDVQAEISGFVARVRVTQTFYNPFDEKIEAVYVFPLPHTAAVDEMTMVVGERRIVGVIKRREEAREIYERALLAGMTASLLEQERPNIFTQSVGNIAPRQEVRVEIAYVDVLDYDMGTYTFHFPMVVGPRYIPGRPTGAQGTGWSPDTTRVPDASRITPPVLKPGFRTGHDVSLAVRLEAGVPIRDLRVESHEADLRRLGRSAATAALLPADAIPNKDFVLKYKVAGDRPEMAVLSHAEPGGDGYFLLMVQPKEVEEELKKAPAREVCFLIDVSGSMSGEPTAKVIEAMQRFFERAKPEDRIQVVTFASRTDKLFDTYVPATATNVSRALAFTNALQGGGGTEMLAGIRAVLADPPDPERVRIVIMLTDGYIGNEAEIIREVGQRAGDQLRFWAIGIGSSPNRYLIDGVAKQGGGMSAVVGLKDDPTELVGRIVERIHRAQLAQIRIDWGAHRVYETYPARIPELWAGRPVILFGRYEPGGSGPVRLNGVVEGKPVSFPLEVSFPAQEPAHGALAKVWARRKIEDLSSQLIVGDDALVEEITELALEYRLMSAYTSFVAVDESERASATETARPPRRIAVPVPMPEGVSYEGVFGSEGDKAEERDVIAAKRPYGRVAFERKAMDRQQGYAYTHVGPPEPMALGERARGDNLPGGVAGGILGGTPALRSMPAPAATPAPVHAAPPPPPPAAQSLALSDVVAIAGPDAQLAQRFQQSAAARHAEAAKALTQARERSSKKDWAGARRRLQLAYLLEDTNLRANPWGDDGTMAAIQAEWAEVETGQAEAAVAALPALGRRLDIVLRNTELETALKTIGSAAGVEIRIVPGSLEDVRELQQRDSLRVAYLDLRHATVAQALSWVAQPAGLEWRIDGGGVVVTSARRALAASAWVYHVGDLALPSMVEHGSDPARAAKQVEAALADFETAARLVLEAKGTSALEACAADMIGPDRLLVLGDARAQSRASVLLRALRDPKADLREAMGRPLTDDALRQLEVLRKKTAARWAAGASRREERARAAALAASYRTLDQFSWALLAAACHSEVDHEAVSEMLEAWTTPALAEALARSSLTLGARSLWAIAEARSAAPSDAALKTLSEAASRTMATALAKRPTLLSAARDEDAYATAVYLSLLRSRAADLLPEPARAPEPATVLSAKPPREVLRSVAAVLLAADANEPALRTHRQSVRKALEEGQLAGDDWTVLTALALRRAGGEDWSAFRQRKIDLARTGTVSGAALRVVNRLDGAALATIPAMR